MQITEKKKWKFLKFLLGGCWRLLKTKKKGKRGEPKPCRTAQLSQTDKRLTSRQQSEACENRSLWLSQAKKRK